MQREQNVKHILSAWCKWNQKLSIFSSPDANGTESKHIFLIQMELKLKHILLSWCNGLKLKHILLTLCKRNSMWSIFSLPDTNRNKVKHILLAQCKWNWKWITFSLPNINGIEIEAFSLADSNKSESEAYYPCPWRRRPWLLMSSL
jgi:hypothetical protein